MAAQRSPSTAPDDLTPGQIEEIDQIFSAMNRNDVPGCAVGVVQEGRLTFGRGYGMASLEHGIPLDTRSVFRMGSVAKQFTAGTVALLALDGGIELDADIRRYLPELPDFRGAGGPVTVRHLVHHTSGYRDYLELVSLSGKREEDFYTEAEVYRLLIRQEELNFPAGSEHLYSNSGYYLLSQLVYRVTGRSLAEVARERFFEPLGMTSTHYHDHWQRVVPRRATGYAPAEWYRPGEPGPPILDDVWPGYLDAAWAGGRDPFGGSEWVVSTTRLPVIGDGGVFSSVQDMARWAAHLLDPRPAAGGAEWRELVGTVGTLANGEALDYAFGLYYGEQRGLKTFGHGGAFVGFRGDVMTWPEVGTAVVTLCNRADVDPAELGLRVGAVVLEGRMDPEPEGSDENAPESRGRAVSDGPIFVELAPEREAAFLGDYRSPELDAVWTLYRTGKGVRLRVGPAGSIPVRALEDGSLFADGIILRLEARGDGRITGLRADAGRVRHLRFVKD